MAISVNIPEEITDYKEKILFGLTVRQLGFGALAVGVAVGTALICSQLLHLPIEISGYIIMIFAVPPLALGFIHKDGMPFEKYAMRWWQHYMGKNLLLYEADLSIDDPFFQMKKMEAENERRSLKDAVQKYEKKVRRSGFDTIQEFQSDFYISTKKSRKAARKRAQSEIKAVKQRCR